PRPDNSRRLRRRRETASDPAPAIRCALSRTDRATAPPEARPAGYPTSGVSPFARPIADSAKGSVRYDDVRRGRGKGNILGRLDRSIVSRNSRDVAHTEVSR